MRLLIVTQVVDSRDPILGFFHQWLTQFARQCEQVTVICLKEGKHDLPGNVRVLSLGKENGVSRATYLFRFYAYMWRERKEYDAVFVHMNPEYVVLGGWLWHLLGKRVGFWYTHKAVTHWLRAAEKLADIIFTASRESFCISSPKVQVVGHGIDTEHFNYQHAAHHEKNTLIAVGRITLIKRVDNMVDVLRLLQEKGRTVNLAIVGSASTDTDAAYEQQVCAHVAKLKHPDAVQFHGAVIHNNLVGILQHQRVMLHLCERGGLDKVVLEAFACGTFVVSTNKEVQAVLPETLRSLQPRGEQPEAVADALIHILQLSDNQYESYARIGREWVLRNHTLSELVIRINDIFLQHDGTQCDRR